MARVTTTLVLGSLLASAGCQDGPTSPPATPASDTALSRDVSNNFGDLFDALEDVRTRILPALGDGPKQRALATAVTDLGRLLTASSASAIDKQLVTTNAAAAQLRGDTTILADLDVVLLTLDLIDAARHPVQSAPRMTSELPGPGRKP